MDNNATTIIIAVVIVLAIVAFAILRNRTTIGKKITSAVNIAGIASVQEELDRQLSFTSDVAAYFKELKLNQQNDLPFIIDGKTFSEHIEGAHPKEYSLFIGVYHKDSDSITNPKLLVADSFDTQTKEVLSKAEDGVVTLA